MPNTSAHNPYKGKPGLANRINAMIFPWMGQAQLGTGGAPDVDRPVREPRPCSTCGRPYSEHQIRRGRTPSESTSVTCPTD